MTFLGLDFGTSAVKALLADADQRVLATATVPLALSRPAPGRSEQDPADRWAAMLEAVDRIGAEQGTALAAVGGIGLSGQMHGAVLLDAAGAVLRPAILWNDVRATLECTELEAAWPSLRRVTGNAAMPGFTAPKLLWVRRYEPEVWARLRTVVLPKAWMRLGLTGELVEDMSDASGTLWLDVGARDWSDHALAMTGLDRSNVPRLVEGNAPAGVLRPALAARWGMNRVIVAGGAGDNAAGAVGVSAIRPGDAFVSLGTSGVLFAVTDTARPAPDRAAHAFCHALPGRWHQMGVTLSAAASLAWWAGGVRERRSRAAGGGRAGGVTEPGAVCAVPGGERTPHNDAALRAGFLELGFDAGRATLTQAVLEGVAFSLRDCREVLRASGTGIDGADVIGGGSRSAEWVRILAAVLGIPLRTLAGGEAGAAFGAARLARMAATGEAPDAVCLPQVHASTVVPDPSLAAAYTARFARFQAVAASGVLRVV